MTVYRNVKGSFGAGVDSWAGAFDVGTDDAWATDVTGDGRSDLVLAHEAEGGGVEYGVAPALPEGGFGVAAVWATISDLDGAAVRHAPADFDRDGRGDLWLLRPSDAGVSLAVLRAKPGSFVLWTVWNSEPGDDLSVDDLKLASTDLDFDGRSDAVLIRDLGDEGTQLLGLRNRADRIARWAPLEDPLLDWSRVLVL